MSRRTRAFVAMAVGVVVALIGVWAFFDHVEGKRAIDLPGLQVVSVTLDCGTISHPAATAKFKTGLFETGAIPITALDRLQFNDECDSARQKKSTVAGALFFGGLVVVLLGYVYRRRSRSAPPP